MNEHPTTWPNFYIVGAIKTGTTSLYNILKNHPQVFFPEMKEPHFFLTIPPTPELIRKRAWIPCTGNPESYQALYRAAGTSRAIGDASPTYLWDKNAARRIHEVRPDARIIIMLRDPIVRAYSHFLMDRNIGFEKEENFCKALVRNTQQKHNNFWIGGLYIEFGLYYEQVQRYLEQFGMENVLILLTDELNKFPDQTLERVTRHLGIDPMPSNVGRDSDAQNTYAEPRFAGLYRFVRQNVFKAEARRKYLPAGLREWLRTSPILYDKKKPPMDDNSRDLLQNIYEPDVRKLEQLLSRDLPELRKSWKRRSDGTLANSTPMSRSVGSAG